MQLIGILNSLEKWTKYFYIKQKQSCSHKTSYQLDIQVKILNFNVRGKNYIKYQKIHSWNRWFQIKQPRGLTDMVNVILLWSKGSNGKWISIGTPSDWRIAIFAAPLSKFYSLKSIFYNKMNNNKNRQKTLLLHRRQQKIPQPSMAKKVHFNAKIKSLHRIANCCTNY